jgi:hypothetical protein
MGKWMLCKVGSMTGMLGVTYLNVIAGNRPVGPPVAAVWAPLAR